VTAKFVQTAFYIFPALAEI